MLDVAELKADSRFQLPQDFLDTLPDECPVCESPLKISEGLTEIKCTNVLCPSKITTRLMRTFELLGIQGMSPARCAGIVKYHNMTTPYMLFNICNEDGTFDTFYDYYQILVKNVDIAPIICKSTDSVEVVKEFTDFLTTNGLTKQDCKLQHISLAENIACSITEQVNTKRTMFLYEFVQLGSYDRVSDNAIFLFSDYQDLDSFYEDLRNGGVEFVKEKLGIELDENGISMLAEQIYKDLQDIEQELYDYVDFVNLKENVVILPLCLSTDVGGGYKSKGDFIMAMRKEFGEQYYVDVVPALTKSCCYFIWSKKGKETSRVKRAKRMGVAIMSAQEFKDYLQSLCI